jgi:hypothetical protein
MDNQIELSDDELRVLQLALSGPLCDLEPGQRQTCLNLRARRLLQQAGEVSMANGWDGSPRAFVLSREGWVRLKSELRQVHAGRR